MLPFVVSGLVVGSVYGLAAMGLTLTYRTTGLLNFAHGGIAMAAAFAFYDLRERRHLPGLLAAAIAVLVVSPILGVAIDRLLFRSLATASQASKVVATVGLLVLLQGACALLFGETPLATSPFLPQQTFTVVGVHVSIDQAIVVGLGLAVVVGLTWFLKRARLGVAMRAVVDDPTLVATAGFRPERVTAATWALGAALAGLAGVLLAPTVGIDTITLTLLVIQAFAPAVVGRLTDLRVAYGAALGLGVTSALLLRALQDNQTLVLGLRPSLSFLLLFSVLALARRGWLRELGTSTPWQGSVRAETGRSWLPVAVLCVVLALTMSRTGVFTLGIAIVLSCIFLSLTVLTGTTGLLNLCPAALAGTGAFAFFHLAGDVDLPFWLAVLAAGVAVVPLGLAIAVPALRLPSLFLALATFGFGLVVDGLLFRWTAFTGSTSGLSQGPRPSVFGSDVAYVLTLVPILVVFMVAVGVVRRLALGRTLVALRDSPAAAAALGVEQLWPRLAVFGISAFMAGVGGALYAGLLQSASTQYFSFGTSLIWVAVVVVGGVERPVGAVLAGFLLAFSPYLLADHPDIARYTTIAFGLGAVLLARRPGGLAGLLADALPGRIVTIRPQASPLDLDLAETAGAAP